MSENYQGSQATVFVHGTYLHAMITHGGLTFVQHKGIGPPYDNIHHM